jgi:hypothetical protein
VLLNSCAVKCVESLFQQLEYCSKDIDQLPGVTLSANDVEMASSWLCEKKILSDVSSRDEEKLRLSCINAGEVIRQSLGWRFFSFE